MQFSVDTDRCVSCGLCLSDCLPRALGMDEEGHPYIKDERLCMHCHHCLALCPTGAISVDGHNPDASRRILNAWPQPEQLENLIKGRRSVRQYRPENVDPALLQQALDAALEAAPYYRVRLVWEKRQAFLEPNPEPCLVYPDSVMREMPEQTNGYFFAVHCAQNTVYFDWFHFIADGHGVSPFLTRILELYCNLRYGTAFANPPIPCSPAYDIAKLVEQYPLQVMDETTMQREVVETCEEPMHRIRIRFAKKDLVAKGVQNGVKPFCALMGLLCIALGEYLGKDTIQYSYSADTRDAMGAPNARYNCVCSFQDGVTLHEGVRLEEFVQQMDRAVKDSLTAERKRRKMADQMGWVYLVDQQKAPLRIKQRVFQMGEYISGIPADFWFSYLGNPLMPNTPELAQYITDFGVWVPPEGGSLCVEASTLNGIITLCIENKVPKAGLPGILRRVLEAEGIPVLEAKALDEV